ncbi:Nitroreductase-like protein [Chytriomyces sp. MP71]|nr:Nitroreductase-like protein [Chytriomyces sp. MP71]
MMARTDGGGTRRGSGSSIVWRPTTTKQYRNDRKPEGDQPPSGQPASPSNSKRSKAHPSNHPPPPTKLLTNGRAMGFVTDLTRRIVTAEDPALSAAVVLLAAAGAYIYVKETTAGPAPISAAIKKKVASGKPTSLPVTLANSDLDNTPFLEVTEIAEAEEADVHDPFDLPHVLFKFDRISHQEALKRSQDFYNLVNARRSLRMFSEDPVPIEVIRNCCMAAATAPSGAHTEPWTFAIVQTRELKKEIREIIEHEERINYESRMSRQWVSDLAKLKTNWEKSNSIACGILITALHNAGLVTLTSTPMNAGPAIRTLLDRPPNEKVQLLLPVGYPAKNATVPDLKRKSANEVIAEF